MKWGLIACMFVAGCSSPPVGMDSAIEVRLSSDAERREFVDILDGQATRGMHVDLASLAQPRFIPKSVPMKSVSAEIWRADDPPVGQQGDTHRNTGRGAGVVYDLRDGRAWVLFLRDGDPAGAYRDAVKAKIKARWPSTKDLPMVDGALPKMFPAT